MEKKNFEIALSGIACAVVALSLTLGVYVDFMLASGYLLAAFAVMVPLSKGHVRGAFLAFLGGTLLAFLFGAFAIYELLPFAAFFGLHPIANHLERRFLKKPWQRILSFFVKAVWFDLAMWLMWGCVLVPIFGVDSARWYPFVMEYFYYVLFLGGTAVFFVYDRLIILCQRSADLAIRRIGR